VLFERDTLAAPDIVGRYEQALAAVPGEPPAASDTEADLRRQVDDLRHQTLTSRDFAIGAEARSPPASRGRPIQGRAGRGVQLDELAGDPPRHRTARKRLKRLAGRTR